MKRFLFFLTMGSWCAGASATVINVPSQYSTIQQGINASQNGDTVLVQPGTYFERIQYRGHNVTVGSLYLLSGDTSFCSATIINGGQGGSTVSFLQDEDSTAMLIGMTVTNGMSNEGGGIKCVNSHPRIRHNIIRHNYGNSGGGIYCSNSHASIAYNDIHHNVFYFPMGNPGGGICCVNGSQNQISFNRIRDNLNQDGAGIALVQSNPVLAYNLIYDNSAMDLGGGLRCDYSQPTISNNTIAQNHAGTGGGLWCTPSNLDIVNTIFWANSAGTGNEIVGSPSISYSAIQGGYAGVGNISADPQFVNAGGNDFHLQANSPCIDAGDPSSPLDPDSTRADMGALYFNQSALPAVDVTLTPINPPIIIPANGGSFSYNIAIANGGSSPATADVWCNITLPNGHLTNPTLGPVNLTLPAGFSLNRDRTQNIPRSAPAGNYTYNGYAGIYPDSIFDQDSFPFNKSPTGDGPEVDNWDNTGESFADWMPPLAAVIPETYTLGQNHPNPFNPRTVLSYQLPVASHVNLVVYDISGRMVATLVNRWREAGSYEASFDASHLSSGIYLYHLTAGSYNASGKMALMK